MIAVKFLFAVCLLFLVSCGIMFQAFAQESKIPDKVATIKEEKINPKTPSETIQANIKNSEERYRIGLHDILEVTVFKHPELSQPNIRMDETGRIRLPRIDSSILAICKTENELSAEIINLYKQNYLRDPYVTVFVKEQNSQPLSVIGAVEKPGNFYTNRRLTLLELLSFAGGQKVEKAGTKIQVARVGGISGCKTNVSAETIESDGVTFFSYVLADVLKGKENPVMRPGDIVVVLEADQVYVTGNVVKPQAILLKQTITLTQAIAAAGGMLPATKQTEVKIVRQEPGSKIKEEFKFDLNAIRAKKIADPELLANDIVEVPTDKVKDFTNNFIRAITGGLGNVFYRIP